MDLTEALAVLRVNPSHEAAKLALFDACERLSRGPGVVPEHRQDAASQVCTRFLQKVRDGLLPDMVVPEAYLRKSIIYASIDLRRRQQREVAASHREFVAPPAEPEIEEDIRALLEQVADQAARLRADPRNGEILRRSWREMQAIYNGFTLTEAVRQEDPELSDDDLAATVIAAHKRHQRTRAAMHERIDARDGKSWPREQAAQVRFALNRFFRKRRLAVRSSDAPTSGGHDDR